MHTEKSRLFYFPETQDNGDLVDYCANNCGPGDALVTWTQGAVKAA